MLDPGVAAERPAAGWEGYDIGSRARDDVSSLRDKCEKSVLFDHPLNAKITLDVDFRKRGMI